MVTGERVGLQKDPLRLSSYRVEIKLKIWLSGSLGNQQAASYFPGDVTTDVGLYPWASAFGLAPAPPMETPSVQ